MAAKPQGWPKYFGERAADCEPRARGALGPVGPLRRAIHYLDAELARHRFWDAAGVCKSRVPAGRSQSSLRANCASAANRSGSQQLMGWQLAWHLRGCQGRCQAQPNRACRDQPKQARHAAAQRPPAADQLAERSEAKAFCQPSPLGPLKRSLAALGQSPEPLKRLAICQPFLVGELCERSPTDGATRPKIGVWECTGPPLADRAAANVGRTGGRAWRPQVAADFAEHRHRDAGPVVAWQRWRVRGSAIGPTVVASRPIRGSQKYFPSLWEPTVLRAAVRLRRTRVRPYIAAVGFADQAW